MEGGCYCGAIRYTAQGKPIMKAQCHCRECQYISGGGPNYYMIVPNDGFEYTKGEPKQFRRADLEEPVTRDFCPTCGTHILTRLIDFPDLILKVGTLDDPAAEYGQSRMAIYTAEKQAWQTIPDDMPCFEGLPPGG